jgi:hypothetical protein
MIKGLGLEALTFIDDMTTPTEIFASYDWNKMEQGEVKSSTNVVIHNTGTEDQTLDFADTLNPSVGVIKWEIEWYKASIDTWLWIDWDASIASGQPYQDEEYIIGTPQNPLSSNQYVGLRPETPQEGNLGHVRFTITIAGDAPFGFADPFITYVEGTEYIS